MASAMQVHPDGRSLYVANRGVGQEDFQGQKVANGSENSVATFAIDPVTGKPRFVQSAALRGIHPRTIGLSPDAKWLVAGTIRPARIRQGNTVGIEKAGLTLFSVGADDRLTFESKLEIDAGKDQVFWSGPVLV